MTLREIKAPPVLTKITNYRRGLVLVTGPTGSGKSTTLAAMIDHINRNRAEHILTIEDPIEYIHEPKQSIINQREIRGSRSFAEALRAALREDPDVILVGEMRDQRPFLWPSPPPKQGTLFWVRCTRTPVRRALTELLMPIQAKSRSRYA